MQKIWSINKNLKCLDYQHWKAKVNRKITMDEEHVVLEVHTSEHY